MPHHPRLSRAAALALGVALGMALCAAHAAAAGATSVPLQPPAAVVSEPTWAADTFRRLRPAVFTIRTFDDSAHEASSQGTGFIVETRGPAATAVTAYHVVAAYVRQPQHQRLEGTLSSGALRPARVLAIDVVHDLALLGLDVGTAPIAPIHLAAAAPDLRIGAAIMAVGDPLGLGMTVMDGHYSGRIVKAGFDRIHWTGGLNPGVSGGPALSTSGDLVGVNVSMRRGAQQVGFLVPAEHVQALLDRAHGASPAPAPSPLPLDQVNVEIQRQLLGFQNHLREDAVAGLWKPIGFGPYQAPDILADQLRCAVSNPSEPDLKEGKVPLKRSRVCVMTETIQVDDNVDTGQFRYSVDYLQAGPLNRFKFNGLVESLGLSSYKNSDEKHFDDPACADHQTMAGPARSLPVRVELCTFRYKEFPQLMDLRLLVITRDRPLEALVVKLNLDGTDAETAAAYTRRLLETLQ